MIRVNCQRNTIFEMARYNQNWLGLYDVKFLWEQFELKIFSKNHKFSSKMTFFSKNDKFQDGLDEAGCRDPSRMKEGIFSHRFSPGRSSPTVTIKRYKLFSGRHNNLPENK